MATGKDLLVTRNAGKTREVPVAFGLSVGGGRPVVIAGPCSVESREQILETARAVKAAGAHALRGGAFKPRTSPYSFQGLGEEGLRLLAEAREATGLPVVTEVMDAADIPLVAEYADVLQVGARNMQNYSLLKALGRVNKPVLLKRGPAATLEEWLLAAEYLLAGGNDRVILCERGIRTFEPYTRNTLDLASALAARQLTHLPVLVDPSHGAGRRELVAPLARAALAAGLDGLLVEVHPDPDQALSDGAQSLDLQAFAALMQDLGLAPAVPEQEPAAAIELQPTAAASEGAPEAPDTRGPVPTATAPKPALAADEVPGSAPAAVAVPVPSGPVTDGEGCLAELRRAIDAVDVQLLELLRRRMELALAVGRQKSQLGLPIYQPLRERLLVESLMAQAVAPLSPALVREVWSVLLRHSRELQTRLVERGAAPA